MKKLLSFILIAATLATVSCSKYDDSAVMGKLNDLESRVTVLETFISTLNSEVTDLHNLVNAALKGTYIVNVEQVENGYKITLSDKTVLNINNGKDGQDGTTPVIGVKKDSDGKYYWTLNGEWLKDASGNKVNAEGKAPVFRMSGNNLQVSYDEGASWTTLCEISGGGVNPAIKQVTYDDEKVSFILADDTVITLPRTSASMTVTITQGEELEFSASEKKTVDYKVNTSDAVKISVIAAGNWTAKALTPTAAEGKIDITAPAEVTEGEILVFAYSKNLVAMTSILCKKASVTPSGKTVKAVLSSSSVTLAAVAGTDKYSATFEIPANEEFIINIDGEDYGFVTSSGNGGVGTVTNAATSALPVSAPNYYYVTKSVGLLGKISASANKLWSKLATAANVKLTVDFQETKTLYRIELVNNDPKCLWSEDFSLCCLGADYRLPLVGYQMPCGAAPANYDGVEPVDKTVTITELANGATVFDYPVKTKIALASNEYMANRDMSDFEMSRCMERPCGLSLGSYKEEGWIKTPKFAGSYTGKVKMNLDIARFEAAKGPIYFTVQGGGKFVGVSVTLDGKSGSHSYSTFAENDTQFALNNDEWCPNTIVKADPMKPVSHFVFELSGVGPDTRIYIDAPLPAGQTNNAPRFFLYKIEAFKNAE